MTKFLVPDGYKHLFFLYVNVVAIMIIEADTLSFQTHLELVLTLHQGAATPVVLISDKKVGGFL